MRAEALIQNISFPDSMQIMEQHFLQVRDGAEARLLAFEYPSLFTLGKSVSQTALRVNLPYPAYATDRGGKISFHNPGQLVIYPIISLRARAWKLRDFVADMELVCQKSLAHFGVASFRRADCPGLYTDKGKIMSLGFRIREGVSTHGLSINISNELSPFQGLPLCSSMSASLDRANNYSSFTCQDFYPVFQQLLGQQLD